MGVPTKLVKVTPESTADDLLDTADAEPVVIERNGVRYLLSRENAERDIWAEYDADRASEVLRAIAGSWADLDTDQMIADIYERRRLGSRPINRP